LRTGSAELRLRVLQQCSVSYPSAATAIFMLSAVYRPLPCSASDRKNGRFEPRLRSFVNEARLPMRHVIGQLMR